eukprot:c487_g1_i1 orf=632-1657(-)
MSSLNSLEDRTESAYDGTFCHGDGGDNNLMIRSAGDNLEENGNQNVNINFDKRSDDITGTPICDQILESPIKKQGIEIKLPSQEHEVMDELQSCTGELKQIRDKNESLVPDDKLQPQQLLSLYEALDGLQYARRRFEEELLQLRNLNALTGLLGENGSEQLYHRHKLYARLTPFLASLEQAGRTVEPSGQWKKLIQEREDLIQELNWQVKNCSELERQLQQERQEKIEAQTQIAILNETIEIAQRKDGSVLEHQICLFNEQQILASKLKATLDKRIAGLGKHAHELQIGCGNLGQSQEISILYSKVWFSALRSIALLFLLCYTVMIFLAPFSLSGQRFVPT